MAERQFSEIDAPNPFAELIGLRLAAAGDGRSQYVLEVSDQLLNPNRVLHGAAMYAMADTGMGAALVSLLERDESCATVEIKINYIRPVTSGHLTCQTKVVHKGKRIAVLESEVENDGRLVARALGTYYIQKIETFQRK
ncbi:MAG TPA: PaaI family thioesterase [Anaerolineae bacterium]